MLRQRIMESTAGLFAHAPYPLANTLAYEGDPGLFGPGSATWTVIGDVSSFIGGIRALLVQAAFPEVAAGVADHSRYRTDPLGRLSRTSAYVTATAFGAVPEVERAVRLVRGAHRGVAGTSPRGREYAADHPELAAWVHNALTDSFLTAYQTYGRERLSPAQADRFVAEQARLGAMLDAAPTPTTAAELRAWLADHPDVTSSPGMQEAIGFLRSPPLPLGVQAAYRLLFWAAAATLPPRLRHVLGVRRVPGAIVVGRVVARFLRWALGASPSWRTALVRAGAEVPAGLFRPRPTPPADEAPSQPREAARA